MDGTNLAELKPSERRKRAKQAGATYGAIEAAEDAADPKASVIALIAKHERASVAALEKQKPSERRKRALKAGASEAEVEAAEDAASKTEERAEEIRERWQEAAELAAAMSIEALRGASRAFAESVHALRPYVGAVETAANLRRLMGGSQLVDSMPEKLQDAYSLRCTPQVLGACLDQLDHAARILLREANAVSDNPILCPKTGDVLSGGNFHAEPVALVADNIALAIAETGSLSERRIAMLVDSSISELPPFLTRNAGLESGFMIAHVTAAALASENKSLAHPASVDSLPTSANQEDHVSMATFAARRLHDMNKNTLQILAVEYLAASQGISLRRPLTSSAHVESAYERLRAHVPEYVQDRVFYPDIEKAVSIINQGQLAKLLPEQPLDTDTQIH